MTLSLGDIESAHRRLQKAVIKTPLIGAAVLNEQLSARVLFKCECLQHIGAFKFRGAYNRLSQISDAEKARGVVAYSSGNHAQGVAYAARLLGIPATIIMPSDAPAIKIEGTRAQAAKIHFYERHRESREEIAAAIAAESGAFIVPSFDDKDVIAGQGTMGIEINEQLQGSKLDVLVAPCGGGGLMAGVSTALKALQPELKVIAVEPQLSDCHRQSQLAGKRVKVDQLAPGFCDALLTPIPGEITWPINRKNVNDFLTVSDDDVAIAVGFAFRYLKLVLEPGAAVGLAAILSGKIPQAELRGKTICVVLSGGNVDVEIFTECLRRYNAR